MNYVIEFLIFAFIGWVLDTTYSSIENKKLTVSGYYKGVPLCPIYGLGGILLLEMFSLLSDLNPIFVILITTFLIVALELFGGLSSEYFLEERLWNYENEFLNYRGYISVWHTILWLIAVTSLYILIGNSSDTIQGKINQQLSLGTELDTVVLLLSFSVILLATIKTKRIRLHGFSRKKNLLK